MPVKAFTDLFEGWNCDENLSVKDLRLKCITLMALTFMARPSDLAPMAEQFDPSVGTSLAYTFTRDQVQFHSDGSMTVTLFGTKNDTGRTGFEIQIPGSDKVRVNVVGSLFAYMRCTEKDTDSGGPLFLTLKAPYQGLRSEGVRKVLSEAIVLAGLGGMGFTPKCFRPTGANAALEAGCTPEAAMQMED